MIEKDLARLLQPTRRATIDLVFSKKAKKTKEVDLGATLPAIAPSDYKEAEALKSQHPKTDTNTPINS